MGILGTAHSSKETNMEELTLRDIVYGARDSKQGMFKMEKNITHPKTKITGGILKEECAYLLSSFFEKKRKLDKKK